MVLERLSFNYPCLDTGRQKPRSRETEWTVLQNCKIYERGEIQFSKPFEFPFYKSAVFPFYRTPATILHWLELQTFVKIFVSIGSIKSKSTLVFRLHGLLSNYVPYSRVINAIFMLNRDITSVYNNVDVVEVILFEPGWRLFLFVFCKRTSEVARNFSSGYVLTDLNKMVEANTGKFIDAKIMKIYLSRVFRYKTALILLKGLWRFTISVSLSNVWHLDFERVARNHYDVWFFFYFLIGIVRKFERVFYMHLCKRVLCAHFDENRKKLNNKLYRKTTSKPCVAIFLNNYL